MVKERNIALFGKTWKIGFILLAFWISIGLLTSEVSAAPPKKVMATSPTDMAYSFWKNLGERAAKESLKGMDLWYLERMDQPEAFVKEIKRFDLPEGLTPKDWFRPGVDPMKELGLVQ